MSLCQFSPARRTPIGLPSSVTLDTTTISGLPGTLHRSPKMLNSISPKRRVKATCCGGVCADRGRRSRHDHCRPARSRRTSRRRCVGPNRHRGSRRRARAPVGTISMDIGGSPVGYRAILTGRADITAGSLPHPCPFGHHPRKRASTRGKASAHHPRPQLDRTRKSRVQATALRRPAM